MLIIIGHAREPVRQFPLEEKLQDLLARVSIIFFSEASRDDVFIPKWSSMCKY